MKMKLQQKSCDWDITQDIWWMKIIMFDYIKVSDSFVAHAVMITNSDWTNGRFQACYYNKSPHHTMMVTSHNKSSIEYHVISHLPW